MNYISIQSRSFPIFREKLFYRLLIQLKCKLLKLCYCFNSFLIHSGKKEQIVVVTENGTSSLKPPSNIYRSGDEENRNILGHMFIPQRFIALSTLLLQGERRGAFIYH